MGWPLLLPSPACGRRWPRGAGSDEGASRSAHRHPTRRKSPHPTLADARATFSRKREKGGRALLFALALWAAPATADPKPADPGIDPSVGKVEVTLDLPKDKPYVGEMIMLRMRSFIRADVVLDQIRQPSLVNFDTQQLGRDRPIQAMVDGFQVAGFERDLAIFPQQAGRLIIEPFVRRVTIQKSDNSRVQVDFASKPVFVDVQNHAGVGAPSAWWLPAKSVTITDNWSVPPDEIKPGSLSRRVVTVEAVGLTADRLPPPPTMQAPGTIVFKGPATRDTAVTEDGPVARARYQWDIRPVSTSPAKLPAIHVPWFDTSERRMRDVAIPDLWVAYVGTLVHAVHEQQKTWAQTYLASGPLTAGAVGLAWTAALAAFLLRSGGRTRGSARRRILKRLRRAARFENEPEVRRALLDLARDDPRRWAAVSAMPLVAERLAALDRARFSAQGGGVPPLAPLAADITRLIEDRAAPTRKSVLPSLDAPVSAAPAANRAGWLRRFAG